MMITRNRGTLYRLIMAFIISMAIIVAAITLLTSTVSADLPDRPDPAPTDQSGSEDADDLIGAYIELTSANQGWSVVQWQDENGDWHNVDGWQGNIDNDGTKRWWVAQKDFGSGPFRWVVLAAPNGQMLANSASFRLPSEVNMIQPVIASQPQ
jgi:hypothetical protein